MTSPPADAEQDAPEDAATARIASELLAGAVLCWEPPTGWATYGSSRAESLTGAEVLRIEGKPRALCVWRREGRTAWIEGVCLGRNTTDVSATLSALLVAIGRALALRGVERVRVRPAHATTHEDVLHGAGYYATPGDEPGVFERVQSLSWKPVLLEPLARAASWVALSSIALAIAAVASERELVAIGMLTWSTLSFLAGVWEGWTERRAIGPWPQVLLAVPAFVLLTWVVVVQVQVTRGTLRGASEPAMTRALQLAQDSLPLALIVGSGFGLAAIGLRTAKSIALVATTLAVVTGAVFLFYPPVLCGALCALAIVGGERVAAGLARLLVRRIRVPIDVAPSPRAGET